MALADGSMWMCECGREFNASKLSKCPSCGRTPGEPAPGARGAGPVGRVAQPIVTSPSSNREAPVAVGARTRELADKVDALGGYLVFVAWTLGVLSVIGGAVLWVVGAESGAGSGGFVSGAVLAVAGLVQAAFVGLVGRYAQMRAAEATGS